MKGIKQALTAVVLAAAVALPAKGADIFNGLRGPTSWQVDLRGMYTEKKDPSHSARLKWWSDTAWAFGVADQSGKFTLGGGPNVRLNTSYGTIGLLPYASITEANEEYTSNIGTLGTWLSEDKNTEIDFSANYNTQSSNFSAGVLGGVGLFKKARIAAGIDWNGEEVQPQVNIRLFSPRTKNHLELKILYTDNIYQASIYGRINLGK